MSLSVFRSLYLVLLNLVKKRFFIFEIKNNAYRPGVFQRILLTIVRYSNEKNIKAPWRASYRKHLLYVSEGIRNNQSLFNPLIYQENRKEDTINLILERFKDYLDSSRSIIDIGCSSGSNLNFFHNKGFNSLYGVEGNQFALKIIQSKYPKLKTDCIYIGDFNQVIPKLPSNNYDVVLLMGTGKYIHPAENYLFNEIVRISVHFILTIENEITFSTLSYPRNFRNVFESLSCKQIDSFIISKANFPFLNDINYIGCMVRLFEKKIKTEKNE